MRHPFPRSLVSAEALLEVIFMDEATGLGISRPDAERLFTTIPASVRSAPAVRFVFSPDWRYAFGKLFHMNDGSHGFGIPHQAPLVLSLVRASLVANRVFASSANRYPWWQQLDNPAKHLDAVVEMLAVAKVMPDHPLVYEQKGLGIRSHKIDWFLTSNNSKILLEVKNRPGQTAQELTRIQSSSKVSGTQTISDEPVTDFDKLFKSTAKKFLPTAAASCIQGAMVFLGIKVPVASFYEYFHQHLRGNLHFVALGKEDKEEGIRVNLLAASEKIASEVLSAFNWHATADLTY